MILTHNDDGGVCLLILFYFHHPFYMYSLELSCKKELPLLLHLFSDVSMGSRRFLLFYGLSFIAVVTYLFKLCQIWSLQVPSSWPFLHGPSIFRIVSNFLAPEERRFLLLEMLFRSQDLGGMDAHRYRDVIVLGHLSRQSWKTYVSTID